MTRGEIKMDIRYRNGKIYILKHKDSDKQYIGSTFKTLNERLNKHRNQYNLYLKGNHQYIYTTSFELFDLGIEGVYIELLENYPCGNLLALQNREADYFESIECINKTLPLSRMTEDEKVKYHQEHSKKHYETNTEKVKERCRKRQAIRLSCIICKKEMSLRSLLRHRRNIHKIN